MARVDTLPHFLTDVADAIRTKKGSQETILASDFDTEIENLPGGQSTPQSVSELNDLIHNVISSFENFLSTVPNSYETYTNEAVTLYTPNVDFQHYLIQKRSSGKYRVVWFSFENILYNNGIKQLKWHTYYPDLTQHVELNVLLERDILPIANAYADYWISQEYDTINECIQKMLNNELSYTLVSNTFLGAVEDTPYIIPYSNSLIMKLENSWVLKPSRRISQNETIVAIE